LLTTLKNINYWFSMDNCFVKASKSYKRILQICLKSFVNSYPDRISQQRAHDQLLCQFTSADSNTRPAEGMWPARGTWAVRDLFHKQEKCSLVIILAHFWSFLLILISIAVQIKPFLNWFGIFYNISWFCSPWYSPQSLFHFNLRHFRSQCGPCIVLSLRLLLYILWTAKKLLNLWYV